MSRLIWPALLLVSLAMTGCGRDGADAGRDRADAMAAQRLSAEQLTAIVEKYYDRWLELNPVVATEQGEHRYDDRFGDYLSPTWLADLLANEQDSLEELRNVDPAALSAADRITYDAFKYGREIAVEGFRYPTELFPIDPWANPAVLLAELGSGHGAQPFATAADYDHFLSRMDGFVDWVEQALNNMRSGVAKGIVQPRVVVERMLPELETIGIENPRDSVFWQPLLQLPAGMSVADRRRIIAAYEKKLGATVLPAYRRLRDYLQNDYLPQARPTVSLAQLPNGAAWYAWLVRACTTTTMTPEQVHELGLAEVTRLRGRIERLRPSLGIGGDLRGIGTSLAADPRFVAADPARLLDRYAAMKPRVEAALRGDFKPAPVADLEVRPVEIFRQESAPPAEYHAAGIDKRPAILYVNTGDLRSRPVYMVDAFYLREAVPGRHLQSSVALSVSGLPSFRRHPAFAAFDQGWAQYALSIGGDEVGVHEDAYGQFGALALELRQAATVVVDTGLHAKGWTRRQAIDYLRANTAGTEADIAVDVARCIADPGQALSGVVGAHLIRLLRERSRRALAGRFDIREFHWQVLEGGSLPLPVLEAKIQNWIEARQ